MTWDLVCDLRAGLIWMEGFDPAVNLCGKKLVSIVYTKNQRLEEETWKISQHT